MLSACDDRWGGVEETLDRSTWKESLFGELLSVVTLLGVSQGMKDEPVVL